MGKSKKNQHGSRSSDDSQSRNSNKLKQNTEEFKIPSDGDYFRNESRFRNSEPLKRHYDNNDGFKKRHSDFNRRNNSNDRRGYKNRDSFDREFATYRSEFESHKGNVEYTKVREIVSDLFEASDDYSLAHCVAEDMNMGSGIAVQFRRQFKRVDELLKQLQCAGGLAVLTDKNRFIYYLVTKQFSYGKPTYATLFSSLKKLRCHVIDNKVEKIAMPRIGCGLDRLDWDNVKFMLEFVFKNVDIEIVVCSLEPKEDCPQQRVKNCKVTHETYPIENIESGTVILYFSSEDGHISEEMGKLDEKIMFLHEFRNARKIVGDVVFYSRKDGYLLCGCIVKKKWEDSFDYIALAKCLSTIQRENKKFKYYYYAFQAMKDRNDPIVNYKIINILRNGIFNGEVYVCWPGDLVNEMSPKDRFDKNIDTSEKNDNRNDWKQEIHMEEKEWRCEQKWQPSQAGSTNWENAKIEETSKNFFEYQLDESHQNSPSENSDTGSEFDSYSDSNSEKNYQNYYFGRSCIMDYYDYRSIDGENWSDECWDDPKLKKDEEPKTENSDYWDGKPQSKKAEEDLDESVKNWDAGAEKLTSNFEAFQLEVQKGLIGDVIKEPKNLPQQYSAVCFVGEDMTFNSGIPPQIDITPFIGKLLNQKQKQGGLAYSKDNRNFLYCLITNPPNGTPNLQSTFSAIQKLHDHVSRNGITTLLLPKNCEKLQWIDVKNMFQYIFKNSKVELMAIPYECESSTRESSKISHVKKALHQMSKKSVILYLASVDGTITKEMEGLSKKFDFTTEFKKKRKNLGDVIKYKENEDHVLYGLIIKKTTSSGIDFEALQKCIHVVNEANQNQEKLTLFGIQAIDDETEGLNYKISTILLKELKNANINMCWPGDLRRLMPQK